MRRGRHTMLLALPFLAAPAWAAPEEGGLNAILRIAERLQALILSHVGEIAVVCLILVGAMWLFSFGSEDGVKRASASLRSVIVGLILVTLAAPLVIGILDLMESLTGVDLSSMKEGISVPLSGE